MLPALRRGRPAGGATNTHAGVRGASGPGEAQRVEADTGTCGDVFKVRDGAAHVRAVRHLLLITTASPWHAPNRLGFTTGGHLVLGAEDRSGRRDHRSHWFHGHRDIKQERVQHMLARVRKVWPNEAAEEWRHGSNEVLEGARLIDMVRLGRTDEVLAALEVERA